MPVPLNLPTIVLPDHANFAAAESRVSKRPTNRTRGDGAAAGDPEGTERSDGGELGGRGATVTELATGVGAAAVGSACRVHDVVARTMNIESTSVLRPGVVTRPD